jgi:hypothetical protein
MKPNWREILRLAAERGAAHSWRILVLESDRAAAGGFSDETPLDVVEETFASEFFNALDEMVIWDDVDA